MEQDSFAIVGTPVPPAALTSAKAREAVALVGAGEFPSVELLGCYAGPQGEGVLVEVCPEVPQHPVHDVRAQEHILVWFDPADACAPEATALRRGFPTVPHTNLRPEGVPRSLCLYDVPYDDQRLTWTAGRFFRQLRRWLDLTARGELHASDQPLEPFLFGSTTTLIVPAAVAALNEEAPALVVHGRAGQDGQPVPPRTLYAAPATGALTPGDDLSLRAIVVDTPPAVHGIIQALPRTVGDLARQLTPLGFDLLAELRDRLATLRTGGNVLAHTPLLLLRVPMSRSPGLPPETLTVRGFIGADTIQALGKAIGAWDEAPGLGLGAWPFGVDLPEGDGFGLHAVNVVSELTAHAAAIVSGTTHDARALVAVGVGALGSQVVMNLLRSGFGRWSVVDGDVLYPHNLTRHALFGAMVGFAKADVVAHLGATLAAEVQVVPFAEDVRHVPSEALAQAYASADVLLDFSASVPVARHLARGIASTARRLSAFLSPSGRDLVLLVESEDRTVRLDALEMAYYRALATDTTLAGHLEGGEERWRYGLTCRDASVPVSQDFVGLHAGLAARAIRQALHEPGAAAVVWRTSEDLSVRRVNVETATYGLVQGGTWTLEVDPRVERDLLRWRDARLPNETGGVLLGAFDYERRVAYVVAALPSPPDSVEQTVAYVRGADGLSRDVDEAVMRTGGGLTYAGEWHSHPTGHATTMSALDIKAYSWLRERLGPEGQPPLMAIAGDTGVAWYLDVADA